LVSHGSLRTWTNQLLHSSIKQTKHIDKVSSIPSKKLTISSKPSLHEYKSVEAAAFHAWNCRQHQQGQNPNKYTSSCLACGIKVQVARTTNGETTQHPYPHHHQLIKECTMCPSLYLQYQVLCLWLEGLIAVILKENFLKESDLKILKELPGTHSRNWTESLLLYKKMISDFPRLKNLDFSLLKAPRLDYANQ
jgi:hypothetical protein